MRQPNYHYIQYAVELSAYPYIELLLKLGIFEISSSREQCH